MHSWQGKPYYSLDAYLKETFGEKMYKLSLDGGMTCPNRDGTIGTGGCIFCSQGGSGDFAGDRADPISLQLDKQKKQMEKKQTGSSYIAYFQAFTNTYAPVERLRALYEEAIADPQVKVLSIATRPDCLGPEVLALLAELRRRCQVWVELGFQTAREETARLIRRGYPNAVFEEAVRRLNEIGIPVIVHVILGLPGENKEDILHTIAYLNRLPVSGIKLQLLHVLKGTDLAVLYEQGACTLPDLESYIDLVISCIRHLRQDIVIHRLTGDGPRELLIAPLWSIRKRAVLNQLHHRMKELGAYQGQALVEVTYDRIITDTV